MNTKAKASWFVLLICSAFFSWSGLWGQNLSDKPHSAEGEDVGAYVAHLTFDVASVREQQEEDGSYINNSPSTSEFSAHGVALEGLILAAYDIKIIASLRGLPNWATTTSYNISAKAGETEDQILGKLSRENFDAEKRHMLQVLLTERFGLRLEQEAALATTYELYSTGRTSSLMTVVTGPVGNTISSCVARYVRQKGMKYESKGCPMPFLLNAIRQALATTITDHTGLTGLYAYTLMWKPTEITAKPDEQWFPEIITAVDDQLGLRLRKTRGTVPKWTVVRIERPSPN